MCKEKWGFKNELLVDDPKRADSIFAAISQHINTYNLIPTALFLSFSLTSILRLCFMLRRRRIYTLLAAWSKAIRKWRRKRRATYKTIKKVSSPREVFFSFSSLSWIYVFVERWMKRKKKRERDEIFGWEIMRCFV